MGGVGLEFLKQEILSSPHHVEEHNRARQCWMLLHAPPFVLVLSILAVFTRVTEEGDSALRNQSKILPPFTLTTQRYYH